MVLLLILFEAYKKKDDFKYFEKRACRYTFPWRPWERVRTAI